MHRTLIAALVAAGTVALAPGAKADAGIKVGELTCHIGREVGLILGASDALGCRFSGLGGTSEAYKGTILKVGIDIGVADAGDLVWTVLAPASNVKPGALAGHYYGVSAEATPGVGVGANVLVGGLDRSISLQPVSVQGETGANIVAALSELTLRGE